MEIPSPRERQIVRAKRAREITGVGKTELYRRSGEVSDSFPAAIKLGDHSVGWYEDELLAWRESRPRVVNKQVGSNTLIATSPKGWIDSVPVKSEAG